MLEKVDLKRKVSKAEYKKEAASLKEQLTALDAPIKAAKLPVIILFEGWSAAGKGSLIQKLILNFDPRWFTVVNMQAPTPTELRYPLMWRHWNTIPKVGQMSIMDSSWYQEVSTLRVEHHVSELENLRHMNEINSFERGLCNNGYLIIKFFIHISKKEMKKRLDALSADKDTAWRVSDADRAQLKNYDQYAECMDSMLEYTNTPEAVWHVISGTDAEAATLDVFSAVVESVQTALKLKADKDELSGYSSSIIQPGQYHFRKMPLLKDVDLDKSLSEKAYKSELKKEQ